MVMALNYQTFMTLSKHLLQCESAPASFPEPALAFFRIDK